MNLRVLCVSVVNTRVVRALIVMLALTSAAFADELTVDQRTVRVDQPVSIVVALEGAFASNDNVNVPVKNLVLDPTPSVSSEFSWINGAMTRRKVFRFMARPVQPGAALVGPLVVNGEGGQRETLPAVSINVVEDRASETNDPLTILHELLATGREPLFVVAEADKTSAFVGEEVVVTWYLYNAAAVEQWQVGAVPKLDDFWSEEIEVQRDQPIDVELDHRILQKMPIRRVALFPLHSGTLKIGGMEVNAQVMRRIDSGPASLFEGSLVETGFDSAPLTIEARPVPPGASAAVVGQLSIACSTPLQKPGGPVAMNVTVSGRANLRGAEAPRFDGPVDGEVQVQPAPLSVQRRAAGVTMSRKWEYLVFPARSGKMIVPPVVLGAFDPATASMQTLRCGGASLAVDEVATHAPLVSAAAPLRRSLRDYLPAAVGIAVALIAGVVIVRRSRSWFATRRQVRSLTRGATPAEVRDRVHAWLHARGLDVNALAIEPGEQGDAYRAFRSLADALDRERIEDGDLELRVRDLVESQKAEGRRQK